jgi:hypothetical protein
MEYAEEHVGRGPRFQKVALGFMPSRSSAYNQRTDVYVAVLIGVAHVAGPQQKGVIQQAAVAILDFPSFL